MRLIKSHSNELKLIGSFENENESRLFNKKLANSIVARNSAPVRADWYLYSVVFKEMLENWTD